MSTTAAARGRILLRKGITQSSTNNQYICTSSRYYSSSSSRHDNDNNKNQREKEDGQLTSFHDLKDLLQSTFPFYNNNNQEGSSIVCAFGYGSGVFSQQQQQQSSGVKQQQQQEEEPANNNQKMLDCILVVQNVQEFHEENIQQNPHHYSGFMRNMLDANWISKFQCHNVDNSLFRNPKIYFNIVDDTKNQTSNNNSRSMKYGIIQHDDLCHDLKNWYSLYFAGRLHKPTIFLDNFSSNDNASSSSSNSLAEQVLEAQTQHNLPAAFSAALLLLLSSQNNNNEIIPLQSLYTTIAKLSYIGDFRTSAGSIAEDPNKIQNLVASAGQLERFHHDLYYPHAIQPLSEMGLMELYSSSSSNDLKNTFLKWDSSNPLAIQQLLQLLPQPIKDELMQKLLNNNSNIISRSTTKPGSMDKIDTSDSTSTKNDDDIMVSKKNNNNIPTILPSILQQIIAPAARYQSLKGLVTAGFQSSLKYAIAKLSKGILLRRQNK